ncbi:MAG: methylmalonyl-CoA mutase family protein [Vicingaceae bacterium]
MSENNSLFKNFKAVSDEEWRQKVIEDLKGKDFSETLVWKDENKIEHHPYYRKSDLEGKDEIKALENNQFKNHSWRFIQQFSSSTENLEKEIQQAKNSGVDEAVVNDFKSYKKSKALFSKSPKEIPNLHFYLSEIDHDASTKIIFCDPIGEMVKSNETNTSEIESLTILFQKRLNQLKPDNFLLINGSLYKNAGATIVDELALTLHHAVEYLDQLTDAGYRADAIARSFTFKLGFGTSYFSEIAKARAFRYLIQKVYHAYEVESKVRVWGEASSYYHSHKDPYNNLIRSTTQCMSAVIGNCDLISLPAFDQWEKASNLGNRMAKNISLILKEESYFNKIEDLASGSYYIEALSNEIAHKAWEKFLSIEKEGGLLKLIANGTLKKILDASATERAKAYRQNKRTIVGANKFVNEAATDLKIANSKDIGIAAKLLSKDMLEE